MPLIKLSNFIGNSDTYCLVCYHLNINLLDNRVYIHITATQGSHGLPRFSPGQQSVNST